MLLRRAAAVGPTSCYLPLKTIPAHREDGAWKHGSAAGLAWACGHRPWSTTMLVHPWRVWLREATSAVLSETRPTQAVWPLHRKLPTGHGATRSPPLQPPLLGATSPRACVVAHGLPQSAAGDLLCAPICCHVFLILRDACSFALVSACFQKQPPPLACGLALAGRTFTSQPGRELGFCSRLSRRPVFFGEGM